jgi:hypothetical protein
MIEGSGSVHRTYVSGSGSRRPKNIRIRNTARRFLLSLAYNCVCRYYYTVVNEVNKHFGLDPDFQFGQRTRIRNPGSDPGNQYGP